METATASLTVEEFYQRRHEWPEEGRWCELVQGRVIELSPPDVLHSGLVLNIAKALGEYAQRTGCGYACFDLGLVVARAPDTVRVANIAYFLQGPRFQFSDASYCEQAPELVVKVASSHDRCASMPQRVQECLESGVALVWVFDPKARCIEVQRRGISKKLIPAEATLSGEHVLPDFQCRVSLLFNVAEW